MTEFSQGVTADGPVLLENGQPMLIDRAVEVLSTLDEVSHHMMEQGTRMAGLEIKSAKLVSKAKHLVDALDDEEKNHGGLVRTESLRAKNELRLELSRWSMK